MISCKLAVCGDRVIRDSVLGNASVINIFDRLVVEAFPVLLPRIACLFIFSRNDDDPSDFPGVKASISIGEDEIIGGPSGIDFHNGYLHRQVLTIEGLVIPKPGTLRAAISLDGKEIGAYEIPVVRGGQPQLRLELQEGEQPTDPKRPAPRAGARGRPAASAKKAKKSKT